MMYSLVVFRLSDWLVLSANEGEQISPLNQRQDALLERTTMSNQWGLPLLIQY
jgi:hypothetical protein